MISLIIILLNLLTIFAHIPVLESVNAYNGQQMIQRLTKDKLLEVSTSSAEFEPYTDNGGTVVAIAGKDFVILAADTRLSDQYMIRSRSWSRVSEILPGTVIGVAGCAADFEGFNVELSTYFRQMSFFGRRKFSVEAAANVISNSLYSRRKLPFLSYVLLAGLDKEGRGVVASFDVLGSYEELLVSSTGKGQQMIDPILDELKVKYLVGREEIRNGHLWDFDEVSGGFVTRGEKPYLNITKDQAVNAIHRCFLAAAEREISIGDSVEIYMVEKNDMGSIDAKKIHRGHLQLPFH